MIGGKISKDDYRQALSKLKSVKSKLKRGPEKINAERKINYLEKVIGKL